MWASHGWYGWACRCPRRGAECEPVLRESDAQQPTADMATGGAHALDSALTGPLAAVGKADGEGPVVGQGYWVTGG